MTGRGLLFLLAFVSLLAMALLGPHVHGTSPLSVAESTQISAIVDTSVEGEEDTFAPSAATSDESLGFAAVCVLVLLLTLVMFATRVAPERAQVRRSWQPEALIPHSSPRGAALPLFLVLSISRT